MYTGSIGVILKGPVTLFCVGLSNQSLIQKTDRKCFLAERFWKSLRTKNDLVETSEFKKNTN